MICQRLGVLRVAVTVVLFTFLSGLAASAAIVVLDATFHSDRMLPEFNSFWKSNYKWGDVIPASNAGGALCVYLHNNGASSVNINDLTINGQSLTAAMKCTEELFYCDKAACGTGTNATMVAAGEPLWWRVSQNPIPAGGTTEVFVRMRFKVQGTLSLSVASIPATVTIGPGDVPRIAGIGFSTDGTKLCLYLRHPVKGTAPTQILVDNVDKTSSCTIAAGDSDYDIQPVYCNLGSAFARGSYHTFQAVYSDGSKATDGLNVYADDFKHCTWGGTGVDPELHSVNLKQGMTAAWYLDGDQYAFFLCDEPDAHESLQGPNKYPAWCPGYLGALAQKLSEESQGHKPNQSQYPTQLNLNGSFKPNNYYVYGHITDIVSVDPYYQTRILDSYWYPNLKNTIPWYRKATYIYAVSSTFQAAVEPGVSQIILNSCRKQDTIDDEGTRRVFRWATPEEKRIEFYYALAAGAKSIAYWWMQVVPPTQDAFAGIGNAVEPGSAALWREMGLLGAEAGTASSIIVNSCPVNVKITAPGKLWTRAILSGGLDTLVLYCVNDDYACDEAGTIIQRIDNAEVSLDLPSWLSSPTNVFEVDYKGIHDVSYGVASGRINLHLGAVDVSRMIIITKDSTLKSTLSSRYASIYGPRVEQLIPMP